MTANAFLIVFVSGFWLMLAVVVKVSNWLAGKRWSDGPSLLVPLFPLAIVMVVLGMGINYLATPWGTWCIVGTHIVWLVTVVIAIWLHPASDPGVGSSQQVR